MGTFALAALSLSIESSPRGHLRPVSPTVYSDFLKII